MITDNGTIDIEFGGPATYCIVVKGELGQEWSDRLAGLAITSTQREGASPHTTLAGRIRDQAELNGILDTLYGLHLPILRVEQVEEVNSEKCAQDLLRRQDSGFEVPGPQDAVL